VYTHTAAATKEHRSGPFCLSRFGFAVFLLIAGLTPAALGYGAPAVTALPSPQTLDSLLTTTLRPPRDLYALTARLKVHTTAPIDPYVNHTPPDYAVGSTVTFYVGNDKNNGFVTEPATLLLKTAHAYFYVQHGFRVDMTALERTADTFEQHIYPTDHAMYGSEWTPGIDDDQHITIFNGHIPPSDLGILWRGPFPPRCKPLQ